jgi:hypothetical protein
MNLSAICAKLKEPIPKPTPSTSPHTKSVVDCAPEVLEHVQKLRHAHNYRVTLSGIALNITFYTSSPEINPTAIDTVLRILNFLLPHRKCASAAVFDIYWCQHLKVLPLQGPLSPVHINTGYAYRCGKHLVVYRQEEWVKVFIHECMHYFGMDTDLDVSPQVQAAFHSVASIELSESYCELWARILHCCLVSVLCGENVAELLRVEQDFAYFQTAKVLDYAGTTYEEVLQGKTQGYREKTNVFAYFAVTCALLHSYRTFPLTFSNLPSFPGLVLRCYKEPTLLRKLKAAEQHVLREKATNSRLYKTTRMTITDMCL